MTFGMETMHIARMATISTIIIFITLILSTTILAAEQNPLERRTKFIIYDNNNAETFASTSQDDNLKEAFADCLASGKYSMVIHGWRESCKTPWAKELRENLIKHRGGCIICMDYSAYADDFGFLCRNFRQISKILTNKLEAFKRLSFPSKSAYMFGFSYGARLIAQAGNDFGPKEIGTVHVCEPAGPCFDNTKNADPKMAAINSQCIHTASGGYGTRERNCNQNWVMGKCGESQIAQRPYPNGNHGLCPQFYNSAFDNVFAAVEKGKTCRQPINGRDATDLPSDNVIRMGFYQNIYNISELNEVNLYAMTSRDPPFN